MSFTSHQILCHLHHIIFYVIYITSDFMSFTSHQILYNLHHSIPVNDINKHSIDIIICRTECKQRKDEAENQFQERVRLTMRSRQADAERNRSRMTSHRASISRMSARASRSMAVSSSEESLADEGNKNALNVGSSHGRHTL
jgi:hypothetical protein